MSPPSSLRVFLVALPDLVCLLVPVDWSFSPVCLWFELWSVDDDVSYKHCVCSWFAGIDCVGVSFQNRQLKFVGCSGLMWSQRVKNLHGYWPAVTVLGVGVQYAVDTCCQQFGVGGGESVSACCGFSVERSPLLEWIFWWWFFLSLSLSLSLRGNKTSPLLVTDRSGPWSKKWMPRINREHPVFAFWQRVYSSCVKRVSSKVKLPNSNSRLKRSFLLQVIYSAKLTYLPLQCKCLVCANIWLTEVSGERKLDEFFRCLSWRYNNAASFSVVVQRWSSFEFVMKINTKQMPGLSQSDFPNKATLL